MAQCHLIQKPRNHSKIVIMEGPDGCGKTNIGHGLALALSIPYFRMQSQHENWRKGGFLNALRYDQTYLLEFLKQTKYDVVLDRAWPSEWVYSQVYKRETDMDLLKRLDEEYSRLGATIIMPVRRDYSKCRADDLVAPEKLPELHDKYMEFLDWTSCSVVTIYVDDYNNDLKRELEVIQPELHFDEHDFRFKVMLAREERKTKFGKGPFTSFKDLIK